MIIQRTFHSSFEMNIDSKMELFIKDNGVVKSVMVGVSKSGQMVLGMKESGKITKLMEKENSGTLTVMCLMENGKMIRPTVTVSILM
jgi:hypothetical protein